MAISRSACAALLLVVLLASGASARKGPHYEDNNHGGRDNGHNSHDDEYDNYTPRGYLVQGNSAFEENRPRDPTPLAPSSAGPYAIAHRGSSGAPFDSHK